MTTRMRWQRPCTVTGGVDVGLAEVVGGAVLVTGGVALAPWWHPDQCQTSAHV